VRLGRFCTKERVRRGGRQGWLPWWSSRRTRSAACRAASRRAP